MLCFLFKSAIQFRLWRIAFMFGVHSRGRWTASKRRRQSGRSVRSGASVQETVKAQVERRRRGRIFPETRFPAPHRLLPPNILRFMSARSFIRLYFGIGSYVRERNRLHSSIVGRCNGCSVQASSNSCTIISTRIVKLSMSNTIDRCLYSKIIPSKKYSQKSNK